MTTERHVRSSIREAYRRGSPWIGLILLSSQAMAVQLPSGKTLSSADDQAGFGRQGGIR